MYKHTHTVLNSGQIAWTSDVSDFAVSIIELGIQVPDYELQDSLGRNYEV
jgi:hypothetical protein